MKTIAVQLTGRGVGAIAVLLVAGPNSGPLLATIVSTERAKRLLSGQSAHTSLLHPETRSPLDDVMAICVAENKYELHLHGGIAVVEAVLNALAIAGATITSPVDAQAAGIFGTGIEGEMHLALPIAQTMSAARLLAAQSSEGLAAWIQRWLAWLPGKTPNDLWRLHSAAQWLLARSATLDKLLHPARIAILGPPNAGKSTLANALLGRPVSITSDIAGTTRDWVDAHATFTTPSHNITVPVLLVDTAGIRTTSDAIEQESITRSHAQADIADVLLLVFDGSQPITSDDLALLRAYKAQRLVVIANKTDAGHTGADDIQRQWPRALELSAARHKGIDQLMLRVLELLDLHNLAATEPFAFAQRQRKLLAKIAVTNEPRPTAELLEEILNTPTKLNQIG